MKNLIGLWPNFFKTIKRFIKGYIYFCNFFYFIRIQKYKQTFY
jgi:hypothetical protein